MLLKPLPRIVPPFAEDVAMEGMGRAGRLIIGIGARVIRVGLRRAVA